MHETFGQGSHATVRYQPHGVHEGVSRGGNGGHGAVRCLPQHAHEAFRRGGQGDQAAVPRSADEAAHRHPRCMDKTCSPTDARVSRRH